MLPVGELQIMIRNINNDSDLNVFHTLDDFLSTPLVRFHCPDWAL